MEFLVTGINSILNRIQGKYRMRPTFYTPIAGTHDASESSWWKDGSPFNLFLKSNNILLLRPTFPFEWTTDLDGTSVFSHILKRGKPTDHRDWLAGGAALDYYYGYDKNFRNLEPRYNRNIICHSHGHQVVMFAASRGLKLNNVIVVGGPVRSDLDSIYREARPNIKRLLSISIENDWWQRLGEFGDGHFGWKSENPYADKNIKIKENIKHGSLLRDSAHFDKWKSQGWLEFLSQTED